MAKPIKFKLKILFSVGFGCLVAWLLHLTGWPEILHMGQGPAVWCASRFWLCFVVPQDAHFLIPALSWFAGWLALASIALAFFVFAVVMRKVWRR